MDLSALRKKFGIPGTLAFDDQNGLVRLHVTTPEANAAMYLQGAHMVQWQPADQPPVLFLSRRSDFAAGKPIRGGIPIAFPWFAADTKQDRINGHPGPAHGFARLQEWTLESARRTDHGMALTLTLGPTEMSRSMGFDRFLLTLDAEIGTELRMALTVRNGADVPLSFEEALHNYFDVIDVHEAVVRGLEPAPYIDKIDNMQTRPATNVPITFSGPVDRIYLDTEAPLTIHDGTQRRNIRLVKVHSRNTVVWNPAKALPDLGEWDWHEMVCVETANVGANAVTLGAGESFTMAQTISVSHA